MYVMWKRKQIHEDAMKMYRTRIPDKQLGNMGKDNNGEAMIWSEGRTDMKKS